MKKAIREHSRAEGHPADRTPEVRRASGEPSGRSIVRPGRAEAGPDDRGPGRGQLAVLLILAAAARDEGTAGPREEAAG